MKEIWQNESIIAHSVVLARSFRHFVGRELITGLMDDVDLSQKIFHAPFVVVSHGTEADPILNYGNAAALVLWEMSWDAFTQTPSRLTAEAPNRSERAQLLAAVTARGFIEDYAGVRISKNGKRFQIEQAIVWNLINEGGQPCGQAATFSEWKFL